MEEELEIELEKEEENLEKTGWFKYLALATALIAVIAAVASLESGTYSNEAVLQKNNAVLSQNKASDQWNYYQAKGIKKNVADGFYQQFGNQAFKAQSDKYAAEQADIQKQAEAFQQQVEDADKSSDHFLEKHHKMAFSVTFFQIAIALAAMSSLMKRRSLFLLSLLSALAGIIFMIYGFVV